MRALEARRYGTLVLLAALLLLAVLSALDANPFFAIPLLLAVFAFLGYAREAGRVLGEEAARRLGLAFSPGPPSGEDLLAVPLFLEGEPKAYGEYRGEVLGRPFRRCEVQVYAARRFGAVGYRFTGPSPRSTWPPGAGPPTPGSAGPLSWPSCCFPGSSSPGTLRASPS